MKIFPVKLHRVAFFLSVVLSLFTSAKEEDLSLQNSEYKTIEILPIYHDPATLEEVFTTEPCNYKWNCEAFSHVWPQTREELVRGILSLRECKKSVHNIHVIAILDSAEEATFRKNLLTWQRNIIVL